MKIENILNPIKIINCKESTNKKIFYMSACILIGIPTLFVPHLVVYLYQRNIKKPEVHSATSKKIDTIFQKKHNPASELRQSKRPTATISSSTVENEYPLEMKRSATSLPEDRIVPLEDSNKIHQETHIADEFPLQMDEKLAFQFVAGPFGDNTSSMEGYPALKMLEASLPILSARALTLGLCQEIYKELEIKTKQATELLQAKDLKDFYTIFQKRFEESRRGCKSFIYSGGWNAPGGGHSIIFEFIPLTNNEWSLRLFSLGAGASNHGRYKNLTFPYIEWRGISEHKLSHFSVIQILWELVDPNSKILNYNESYIYEKFFQVLSPRAIQPATHFANKQVLKSLQTIGNCPEKTLFNAYFGTYLPLSEYKRLMCDIKLKAIKDLINFKYTCFDTESRKNFIKKSIHFTANYIIKQIDNKTVDSSYLNKIYEIFEKYKNSELSRIKSTNQNYAENRLELSLRGVAQIPRYITSKKNESIDDTNFLRDVSFDYQSLEIYTEIINLVPKKSVKLDDFIALQNVLQKAPYYNNRNIAIHLGLLEYMNEILKLDFSKIKKDDASELLSITGFIVNDVCNRSFNHTIDVASPEKIVILLFIYAIQNKLSQIAFNAPHPFYPIFHQKWFNILNKNYLQNFQLICKFLEEIPNGNGSSYIPKPDMHHSIFEKIAANYFPDFASFYFRGFKEVNQALINMLIATDLPDPLKAMRDVVSILGILKTKSRFIKNSSFKEISFNNRHRPTHPNYVSEEKPIYSNFLNGELLIPEFRSYYESAKNAFEGNFYTKDYNNISHSKRQQLNYILRILNSELVYNEILGLITQNFHLLKLNYVRQIILHQIVNKTPITSRGHYPWASIFRLQAFLLKQLQPEIDVDIALFVTRALRYLNEIYPSDYQNKLDPFLIQLDAETSENVEKNRRVKAEFIALQVHKEQIQEEHLNHYLKAVHTLRNTPFTLDEVDDQLIIEIEKAKFKHARQVLAYVQRKPEVINIILEVKESWSQDKNIKGLFKTPNQEMVFYPMDGCLWDQKVAGKTVALPREIINSYSFKKLFPNVSHAILKTNVGLRFYEFKHPFKKNNVLVDASNLTIIQNFPAYGLEPYSYHSLSLDNKGESSPLYSLIFHHHYNLWIKDGHDKFVLENAFTFQVEFHGELKKANNVYHIVKIRDVNYDLDYVIPPRNLAAIEDLRFIQTWVNPNRELLKISFHRLGLNFEWQKEGLYCKKIDCFFDLNRLDKIISRFNYGKILKTSEGKEVVLLPRYKWEEDRPKEALEAKITYDPQLEITQNNSIPFYLLEMGEKGELLAKNIEEEAYLALIYALSQHYSKAAKILKKMKGNLKTFHEHPTLDKDLKSLLKIKKISGDTDPNLAILQVLAGLILYNHQIETDHEEAQVTKYYIEAKYEGVMYKRSQLRIFPLSDSDVKLLEEWIGTSNFDLNPEIEIQTQYKKKIECLTEGFLKSLLQYKTYEIIFERPPITDPKAYEEAFSKCYATILESSSQELDWFYHTSYFFESKSLGELVRIMVKNREQFPKPKYKQEFTGEIIEGIHKTYVEIKLKEEPKEIAPRTVQTTILPYLPKQPSLLQLNKFRYEIPNVEFLPYPSLEECFDFIPQVKQPVDPVQEFLIGLVKSQNDPNAIVYLEKIISDTKTFANRFEAQYSLNHLDKLETQLRQLDFQQEENQLKKEVLEVSNHAPYVWQEAEDYKRNKISGKIKKINFDQLLIHFAREDLLALKKLNPYLTQEDVQTLFTSISKFLLLATKSQQIKRILIQIKNLKAQNTQEEKNAFIQELAAVCLAKPAYHFAPETHPHHLVYLTFEYFSDLLLKPAQIELVEKFLSSGDQNHIQELIMGSGKTKVIMILLALLMADGDTLSTIVVDEQFFKDVSSYSHEKLFKMFGQLLKTFRMERSTTLNEQYLSSTLHLLESTQKEKNALIISGKTLKILLLRYIKLWQESLEREEISKELKLFEKITHVLQESHLLLDEGHLQLSVLLTTTFSLGNKQSITQADLSLLKELFQLIFTDLELKKLVKLDSAIYRNENSNTPWLNKENFISLYQTPLAIKALNLLKLPLNKEDRESLIHFITQNKDLSKEQALRANKAYQNLASSDQRKLSLLALEIGYLLQNTLTKPWNEKYGIPEGEYFAIPFKFMGVFQKGTEFSNPYVTLNYTMQTFMKKGIEEALLKKILIETENNNKKGIRQWYRNTACTDFGAANEEDWSRIYKTINQDIVLKFQFAFEFILSKLEYTDKKISANPFHLTSIGEKVNAFSGTLWNSSTYDQKLIPEIDRTIIPKTLHLLMRNSNEAAYILDDTSLENLLSSLKKLPHFDLFCDAGAILRNESMPTVAQAFQRQFSRPVLYYHNQEKKLLSDDINKDAVPITLLEQCFTTGADTAQPFKAVGIVTIKQEMLLNDLLQAVWRLRGLDKQQTVKWGITPLVAGLIRSKLKLDNKRTIGLEEIISYCIQNTVKRLGPDNQVAYVQQMQAVMQNLIKDSLTTSLSPSEIKSLKEPLNKFWIMDDRFNPMNMIHSMPEKKSGLDVIESVYSSYLEALNLLKKKKIFTDAKIEKAKQALLKIKTYFSQPGVLPAIWNSSSDVVEDVAYKEKEKENFVEKQTEMEEKPFKFDFYQFNHCKKVIELTDPNVVINCKNGVADQRMLPFVNFSLYLHSHPELEFLKSALSDIYFSFSFAYNVHRADQVTIKDYVLYNRYQKLVDYICFYEGKLILISQENASDLLRNTEKNYEIFSLQAEAFVNQNRYLTSEEAKVIIKARFLGGYSSFDQVHEIPLLKEWLKNNHPEKMKQFFLNTVLPCFCFQKEKYEGSDLQRIFDELI